MKTSFEKFTRTTLAAALVAGFSMGGASAVLEPPGEFTVAKDGDNLQVGFGTVVGQTYSVEKSTTLASGSWTEILSNVAGTGGVQTTTDAGAGSLPQCFYRIRYGATSSVLTGMALIPVGSFQMGNALSASGDGFSDELPLHTVSVSSFYIEKALVTRALWDDVYTWAVAHGYGFDHAGWGEAANYPGGGMDWWDCVKWCNARSEKESLVPCYTVGGATYRTGQSAPVLNRNVSGYRLPTEAEWEKAARGGLSGKRFPWGDTISRSWANYHVVSSDGTTNFFSYDQGTPIGYDPAWATGMGTSPVGSFPPNGYGLYDMAGNAREWCWDWYGAYGSGAVSDPAGRASGSYRVVRGGSWLSHASNCRAAARGGYSPDNYANDVGFRCARSSVP